MTKCNIKDIGTQHLTEQVTITEVVVSLCGRNFLTDEDFDSTSPLNESDGVVDVDHDELYCGQCQRFL